MLLLEERIYYGDESGFSLDPGLAYGWQPKAEYVKLVPQKSKRLHVFGLLSRDTHLPAYSSEQTMDGAMLVACLDDFATQLTQKTVVVLDNATIHHSEAVEMKIEEWLEQDLHIFFLPTYSPHLNLIETLWRKIKYDWLKPHHYLNWHTLTTAIEEMSTHVGRTFTIDFQELKHFTQFKTSFILK